MPTHALGAGTCNVSVNVPQYMRRQLGQMAFRADVSLGEFVRRMMARAAAIWRGAVSANAAAVADAQALAILRAAAADGIGPEDAPAIREAMELVEFSEQQDRLIAEEIDMNNKL